MKIKTHIDIETGDPDDLWTLGVMSTHPKIDLLGVTVFPGGRDQIGLVRKILNLLGKSSVPIGANVKNDGKSRVSPYYSSWLGEITPSDPDTDVLGIYEITKGTNLFTGGPLSNIKAIQHAKSPTRIFDHWTCQGGFVGCNIIPNEQALEKFKGMDCVQTFNLNGDPKGALELLAEQNQFGSIRMVGKNVCHGFTLDITEVNKLPRGKHDGLDLMIDGIKHYYNKKTDSKAMHDILAALLFIDSSYGTWVTGIPFRKSGKWGFLRREGSNIRALIDVDKEHVLFELWGNT